jgi:hypothetical protein
MDTSVDVMDTKNVELGDVGTEPMHRQLTEFSWHNIAVGRKEEGSGYRSVLHGLSGVARAGRLFAIMGPW